MAELPRDPCCNSPLQGGKVTAVPDVSPGKEPMRSPQSRKEAGESPRVGYPHLSQSNRLLSQGEAKYHASPTEIKEKIKTTACSTHLIEFLSSLLPYSN